MCPGDVTFTNNRAGANAGAIHVEGIGDTVTALDIRNNGNVLFEKNAVVDSGSIEYEGSDLLQLSENEMQGLRGKRIALIFQDPLSALNPIMKIGKQITETIMLDKKTTRKEAKAKAIE